jgi:hypothetical protein
MARWWYGKRLAALSAPKFPSRNGRPVLPCRHMFLVDGVASNLKRLSQRSRQKNSPLHDSHPDYVLALAPHRVLASILLHPQPVTRQIPPACVHSTTSATLNDGANHQPPHSPRGRDRQPRTSVLTLPLHYPTQVSFSRLTQYISVEQIPVPTR